MQRTLRRIELAKRMNKLSADYASRKKAGDALSKTAEADRTREINEKLAPMYAHLEEANNLPANSLSFTGRTKEKGANQQYELAVVNREEAFWVRLREGHLVVVKKARQGAPKTAKAAAKTALRKPKITAPAPSHPKQPPTKAHRQAAWVKQRPQRADESQNPTDDVAELTEPTTCHTDNIATPLTAGMFRIFLLLFA